MSDDLAATVGAAQRGDEAAYGRLVEVHWADMVRLARSVAGEMEAEDVTQDAFITAWHKLHTLLDHDRFKAWLTRIVYRRAVRRARWTRLRLAWGWSPEASESPDLESQMSLWSLLARLPPRQRAVLHLTVVEGMVDSEVGEVLGITAGSVRSHRRRARESLARFWATGRPA